MWEKEKNKCDILKKKDHFKGDTMLVQKFTVREIIFIAILSGALTLAGLVTMPLVMSVTLFGARNLVSSIFYGFFAIIGIMKVRKFGTLTLMGLFHASILLFMAPVMFFTVFFGAMASEILTLIIFRSYEIRQARILAATMFIPFTMPSTLIFTMMIHGMTLQEILSNPILAVLFTFGTIILGFVSSRVGEKAGLELKKAGKL